jgi:hypothetical protein
LPNFAQNVPPKRKRRTGAGAGKIWGGLGISGAKGEKQGINGQKVIGLGKAEEKERSWGKVGKSK